jgi:hypothetical protein
VEQLLPSRSPLPLLAVAFAFAFATLGCHPDRSATLAVTLSETQVLAVILSAAKDPEELDSPRP